MRLTKQAAKAFFDEFDTPWPVAQEVNRLLSNAASVLHAVRIDRAKPDAVALYVIAHVLLTHLRTGRFHVYRGQLSLIGNDMLASFNTVQMLRVERGYCSEIAASEDAQWLSDRIKEAG